MPAGLSRATRSRRLARGPLADLVDAGLELGGGRGGCCGASALLAQGCVGDAVGLSGAVVPGCDESVELAAQDGEALVGDQVGFLVDGAEAGSLLAGGVVEVAALLLPVLEQAADLVGL